MLSLSLWTFYKGSMDMKLSGGCLCGFIRFTAINPSSPHSCSCDMCQKHTGCHTAVWIEFDSADVEWTAEGGTIAVPLISSFIQSILRPVWHLGRCYWWLSRNCFAERYIWQQPTRLIFPIIPFISRYETWMVENNHAWYRWINAEALHVAIMMSLKVEGEY